MVLDVGFSQVCLMYLSSNVIYPSPCDLCSPLTDWGNSLSKNTHGLFEGNVLTKHSKMCVGPVTD